MSELKAIRGVDIHDDVEFGYGDEDRASVLYYLKSEADKVIAEKDAIIEEQAKEIKFMHQHCKHGEHCGTSCSQIHGELMKSTIEIAELEDKLQNVSSLLKETREWLIESQKLHKRCADNAVKVIYHNKYKRCLEKYRYCAIKALYELDFKGNDVEWKWYSKWMHKWFKLAEKFKPNNEADNVNN